MVIQQHIAQCKRNILITFASCMLILAAGYTWVIYNQLHNCFEQHVQHSTLPQDHNLLWQQYQSQWLITMLISLSFIALVCLFLYRPLHKAQLFLQAQYSALAEEADQGSDDLEKINAELKTFAYSVSHDLRGPLRSLDGFALALYEGYHDKLDDEAKDFIRRIRRASQRMATLIDAMLVLSHVSQAELHLIPTNLSLMAEKSLLQLQAEHPNCQFDVYIEPNMLTVADPTLMRQVIENLFHNAWKFSQTKATTIIRFQSYMENKQLIYSIKDHGVGFDPAYQRKLFLPFQRLHQQNEFEGTGIGLPIVQRIIQRHGGIISAESAIDKGATFFFNIPVSTEI